MRKYLNNPWVVSTLAVAALLAAARAVMAARDDAAPSLSPLAAEAPAVAAAPGAAPVAVADADAAVAAPLPCARPEDPFRGDSAGGRGAAPLRLSALWTENGRTLAVLSGRIVGAGERVGTATVIAAGPQGLTLEDDAGRGFISLGQSWTGGRP